ncbi:MAG TPA: DUF4440 domain-containing protein [Candidatus Eisenbacteria bacterium]|nr:DUF4440 domain-containing protein [Candidatus Eisenbacteria bacterium]
MMLERFRSCCVLRAAAWIGALAVLGLAGCVPQTHEDAADVRGAVDASNRQFMDAFARGDAARISTLYADDAQLFPPGNLPVQGRADIEALWRGVLALPVKEMHLTTVEFTVHGEDASEIGRYTLVGNDGRELDAGKYIVLWKKGAGGWKLHRDMWNSNAPVVTSPPSAPPDSTP